MTLCFASSCLGNTIRKFKIYLLAANTLYNNLDTINSGDDLETLATLPTNQDKIMILENEEPKLDISTGNYTMHFGKENVQPAV